MSILDDAEKAMAKAKKMADQADVVLNKKKQVDTLKIRRKGVEKGKGQIQDYTDDVRKIGTEMSDTAESLSRGFSGVTSMSTAANTINSNAGSVYDMTTTGDIDALGDESYRLSRAIGNAERELTNAEYELDKISREDMD